MSAVVPEPATPPPPLRVAVVGPGGWGHQHVRIFRGRPDTELVAIVGRDPDRTKLQAAVDHTHGYTRIAEMLDAEQPDLVTVCLPNEHHFGPTLELLQAGVPLLVEKPLVFHLDEADELLDAATERGTFFAINFNHRYAEPVLRVRAAIAAGELGEIVFAAWRFGGEPNFGNHPHAQLIETQCHGFDMLEHLCGPIVSVMAQMTNKTHGSYTTAAIALQFADAAVGSLLGSYDSSYAYPLTHYLELNGTIGRALIEDTVKRLTIQHVGDETRQVWEAGYFNDIDREFHRTFDRHVDALIPALRTGQAPPVPATAGRRALQLALASIQSFETGQRVTTEPTSDEFGHAD
jgi:predicted dehydrogenase